MENLFKKNFITREDNELEKLFKTDMPEIRIHLRLMQGVLPVIIFRAIGNDMLKTISNEIFLKAFLNPSSQATPSLVFHFEGVTKSFEFKIQ